MYYGIMQQLSKPKQTAENQIKKTIGTLNKSLAMIEEDRYCPEILQQIASAIGILQSTRKSLLQGHLDNCIETQLKTNKAKAIDELIKIFDLK